jgi:uncharacterized protein YigE (DUF2233 family)
MIWMPRCFLASLLAWASVAAAQNWSQVGTFEALAGQFDDQGQQIHFVLLRADPSRTSIRIVDTFELLHKANAYSPFSIAEVKTATKARAVVNAGSTNSFSIPDPVGLLETNGRVISRENRSVKYGGVLCIGRTSVSIFPVPMPKTANCIHAVQRGPVLGPDLQYPASYSQEKYTRSAVAVDTNGRLIVLVTNDPVSLHSMARFLYKSTLNLSLRSILNLDGGPSSGLILSSEHTGIPPTIGNVDALVASAIAIY